MKYLKYALVLLMVGLLAVLPIAVGACDYRKHHHTEECIGGLLIGKDWDEQYLNGPDRIPGTYDDIYEGDSDVTTSVLGTCGQPAPQPVFQYQNKCDGTTLTVWKEVSNDGGKTWNKVEGSDVTTEQSVECGYTPVVNPNPTPEPTGKWCTECQKVIVNPQWVHCDLNLAADVESITFADRTFVKGVDYRQMAWNSVWFADGDLMNWLAKSQTVLKMMLTNSEEIHLQVTPGEDHGYSKGFFIQWSSTWGDKKPAPGTLTSSDPTGKGPDCVDVVVWKNE